MTMPRFIITWYSQADRLVRMFFDEATYSDWKQELATAAAYVDGQVQGGKAGGAKVIYGYELKSAVQRTGRQRRQRS